jgi:alanyl-tRNA synthetase
LKKKGERLRALKDKLEGRVLSPMHARYEEFFKNSSHIGQVRLFVRQEPLATPDLFQKTFAHLKGLKTPFVALWQCGGADKVTFLVGATDDLVAKGFHSGNIVKEVAKLVEGNGGGRPEMAIGGGKRADLAKEAVQLGEKMIAERLTQMREG